MATTNFNTIVKRDGRTATFDKKRIEQAIFAAARAVGGTDRRIAEKLADLVVDDLAQNTGGDVPTVEQVQDFVERTLIKAGYADTAKAYILYRDRRSRAREKVQVRTTAQGEQSTTDMLLLVSGSSKDQFISWDKAKIVEALQTEAGLEGDLPFDIASSVERKIIEARMTTVSTSLIRALVDNELFERGLGQKIAQQGELGVPVSDLNKMLFSMSEENANVIANNPEAVNLGIAERVLKQYALQNVFSKDVADAHLKGALHLHDLGYIVRAYCSAHSLEFIKKYGLSLLNLSTSSAPAKHANTLTGHLNTFLASMQAYYAGALGIGYLNIFYAPLLRGIDYNKMVQNAQYLIFSASQNAFSRGGQTLFIDFNIHLGVPSYLKNVPAVGPKGKYMLQKPDGTIEGLDEVPRDKHHDVIQPPEKEGRILTYGDFQKETRDFARALLTVWRDGDQYGRVFPFPKCDLHINEETFSDPEQYDLFKFACEVSAHNGSPYFVFDRDEVNLSMCCRLRHKIVDLYEVKHPESMRFCGFQNVTINLPQMAYRAGKRNVDGAIAELYTFMEIAKKAHLQKKDFVSRLRERGAPLYQVGKPMPDGKPYIDLERATYIIGMVGLNEAVKYLLDADLNTDEGFAAGLKIISAMYLKAKELEKETGLHFTLEESPAESASYRFARVDMMEYPQATDYVRGDLETGKVYYTNSVHLPADAGSDIIERIEKQAKFNQLIESGAITHVFLGEQRPGPRAIEALVKKTWENTQSAQLVISPEYTFCEECHRISPGFARTASAHTHIHKHHTPPNKGEEE